MGVKARGMGILVHGAVGGGWALGWGMIRGSDGKGGDDAWSSGWARIVGERGGSLVMFGNCCGLVFLCVSSVVCSVIVVCVSSV
jgi:hypothetical protein